MMIRSLSMPEIAGIYQEHLLKDFPANEVKPLFVMESLLGKQLYQCYGLFDEADGEPQTAAADRSGPAPGTEIQPDAGVATSHMPALLGYAFLCHGHRSSSLILDYFAVVSHNRQQGYGSKFLELLRNQFQDIAGILAEVECVEQGADETERQVRQRRLDFYLRNGFCLTRVTGKIFGVDYDIVFLPIAKQCQDQFVCAEMEEIYRTMIPKLMFWKNVHLKIKGSH